MRIRDIAALVGLGALALLLPPGCGCQPENPPFPQPQLNENIYAPDGTNISIYQGAGDPITRVSYGGPSSANCTQDGKYAGGDPSALERTDDALKQTIEKLKEDYSREKDAVDRCKGKRKHYLEYDKEMGCNRALVAGTKERARKSNVQIEKIQEEIKYQTAELGYARDEMRELSGTMQEAAGDDKRYAPLRAKFDAAKDRAEGHQRRVENLNQNIADIQNKITQEADQGRANEERCRQSKASYNADPCSSDALDRHNAALQSAADRLVSYESRRSWIKSCRDDQKKQAGQSARPTIDPSVVPGIIQGFGTRTRRPSSPPPSSHKE